MAVYAENAAKNNRMMRMKVTTKDTFARNPTTATIKNADARSPMTATTRNVVGRSPMTATTRNVVGRSRTTVMAKNAERKSTTKPIARSIVSRAPSLMTQQTQTMIRTDGVVTEDLSSILVSRTNAEEMGNGNVRIKNTRTTAHGIDYTKSVALLKYYSF